MPHARCVILIEACEESGSYDLPYYVDHLAARLGNPSLVVCLDSGCGNYDQLWLTTSLRGMVVGHAQGPRARRGRAFGPRLGCGAVELSHHAPAALAARGRGDRCGPPARALCPGPRRARGAGAPCRGGAGRNGLHRVPVRAGRGADGRRSRRAGAEPHLAAATGGHRDRRTAEPRRRRQRAAAVYRGQIEPAAAADPGRRGRRRRCCATCSKTTRPTARRSNSTLGSSATGWNAPALAPWLEQSLARASEAAFGAPPAYMGEGGSIPFMAMLGEKFPQAQFVVTGVLGPHSNAHGPNEFLHIPTGQRVTAVIAQVLADHHARPDLYSSRYIATRATGSTGHSLGRCRRSCVCPCPIERRPIRVRPGLSIPSIVGRIAGPYSEARSG